MTGSVDRRGKYWNRTDDADVNRGIHSKLNTDQMKERARLHAERLAYGKPTIQGIVDHWFKKYQISIHYKTEQEWSWRNERLIMDAMNQMLDSGDMKLNVTNNTLLNTINVSGVATGTTLKALEDKFHQVLKKIDFDLNPMKALGIDEEAYASYDEPTKAIWDAKIKVQETKNKFCVKMLTELSLMIKDHKKVLLDTISTTKDIYDDAELSKIKMKQEVRKAVSAKVAEVQGGSEFNAVDVEVSDEDRKSIRINEP